MQEDGIPILTDVHASADKSSTKPVLLSADLLAQIISQIRPILEDEIERSVAQKMIKHFISLGVDSFVIVDAMLYSIEIAQTYSSNKEIKQELFFKSMLNSFELAISFMIENGVLYDFKNRCNAT